MSTTRIRFDEWIKALRPDAQNTSDSFMVLEGFIGESNVKGHIRVYMDEALNNFIEVPESNIVHCLEQNNSILGGSKLWINADSVYIYGNPQEKKRPKGLFLQGNLVAYKLKDDKWGIPPNYQISELFGCPAQYTVEFCPQNTNFTECGGCPPPCYKGTLYLTPQCTSKIPPFCFQTCGIACAFSRPILCTQLEVTPTITPRYSAQRFNMFGGNTGYESFDPYQGL